MLAVHAARAILAGIAVHVSQVIRANRGILAVNAANLAFVKLAARCSYPSAALQGIPVSRAVIRAILPDDAINAVIRTIHAVIHAIRVNRVSHAVIRVMNLAIRAVIHQNDQNRAVIHVIRLNQASHAMIRVFFAVIRAHHANSNDRVLIDVICTSRADPVASRTAIRAVIRPVIRVVILANHANHAAMRAIRVNHTRFAGTIVIHVSDESHAVIRAVIRAIRVNHESLAVIRAVIRACRLAASAAFRVLAARLPSVSRSCSAFRVSTAWLFVNSCSRATCELFVHSHQSNIPFLPVDVYRSISTSRRLPFHFYQSAATFQFLPVDVYLSIFSSRRLPFHFYQSASTIQFKVPDRIYRCR